MTKHGKGPDRTAIIDAVTEHFQDYPEPGDTIYLMRQMFGMALESSTMDAMGGHERSRFYDHMEGLVSLIERLETALPVN